MIEWNVALQVNLPVTDFEESAINTTHASASTQVCISPLRSAAGCSFGFCELRKSQVLRFWAERPDFHVPKSLVVENQKLEEIKFRTCTSWLSNTLTRPLIPFVNGR